MHVLWQRYEVHGRGKTAMMWLVDNNFIACSGAASHSNTIILSFSISAPSQPRCCSVALVIALIVGCVLVAVRPVSPARCHHNAPGVPDM